MIDSLFTGFNNKKREISPNRGNKRSLALREETPAENSGAKRLRSDLHPCDTEGVNATSVEPKDTKGGFLHRLSIWLSNLVSTEDVVTVEHRQRPENNDSRRTMIEQSNLSYSEKLNKNGNCSIEADGSPRQDKPNIRRNYNSAIKISRVNKDYSYLDEQDSFRFQPSLTSTFERTNIRKKSLLKAAYQTSSEKKLTSMSDESLTFFKPTIAKSGNFSRMRHGSSDSRGTATASFLRGSVTAHESFKLDEKLRYKNLLQNFTSSVIHTSGNLTRKYLHRPAGDLVAFEKAHRAGAIVKQCFDSIWGKQKKAQLEKTETPLMKSPNVSSLHSKNNSKLLDVIELDSSDDEQKTETADDDDVVITDEIIKTPPAKNSLEARLQTSPFYTGDHFKQRKEQHEWRMKRQSEAADAAIEKSRLLASLRKQYDSNLEDKIARRFAQLELKYPTRVIEVPKEEPLPDLTKPIMAVIYKALKGGPPNQVLADKFSIKVTRKDIHTLVGLNWLNDEVINFYMNLIMDRNQTKKLSKVYAFNTFFYPKLSKTGYATVKRWTKKVDIFSHDLLFVPVHLGMHWCLATIDFRDKTVRYYDSMHGDNYRCLQELLAYLPEEHNDKKKENYDISNWSIENIKDIPQQMNGSDCGMFSCKFAEYLARDVDISFTQENMPYFRQRMIYEICSTTIM